MNDNDTDDDDTDNDELFWGMVDWQIGTGLISSRHKLTRILTTVESL